MVRDLSEIGILSPKNHRFYKFRNLFLLTATKFLLLQIRTKLFLDFFTDCRYDRVISIVIRCEESEVQLWYP